MKLRKTIVLFGCIQLALLSHLVNAASLKDVEEMRTAVLGKSLATEGWHHVYVDYQSGGYGNESREDGRAFYPPYDDLPITKMRYLPCDRLPDGSHFRDDLLDCSKVIVSAPTPGQILWHNRDKSLSWDGFEAVRDRSIYYDYSKTYQRFVVLEMDHTSVTRGRKETIKGYEHSVSYKIQ